MSGDERALLRRDFLLEGGPAPVWRACTGQGPAGRPSCCIAIGAFDGLHRGHRDLLDKLVAEARAQGLAAVAVTFDPDPDQVVSAQPASKLLLPADRWEAIARSGVDAVLVIPFDRELAACDHRAFFQRVLLPLLDVRSVYVGADFHLGAHGQGTVEVMRAWGAGHGIDVHACELLCEGGEAITATRVRGLIGRADLAGAERCLGRRYFVRGTVVPGRHQGANLGFPTANIELPALVQRPAEGVYAGFAFDGATAWPAAINVGLPPTFKGAAGAAELEANILGFDRNIYGQPLTLLFTELLRGQRAFASTGELVATVRGNIQDVRDRYGDEGRVLAP